VTSLVRPGTFPKNQIINLAPALSNQKCVRDAAVRVVDFNLTHCSRVGEGPRAEVIRRRRIGKELNEPEAATRRAATVPSAIANRVSNQMVYSRRPRLHPV
jgi:hypothetical protein